jgi:hypothetical protein
VLQTASGKMIFGKLDETPKPEPIRAVEVSGTVSGTQA